MKTIALLFISLLLCTGCIRETLEECPVGGVKIQVYVEKFQTVTHNYRTDMEPSFQTRIKDIHYLLFKENVLIEEGRIDDCSPFSEPFYTFQRGDLEFGEYCLALVSNCKAFVGGNTPDDLFLTYAGVDNKEDHFATCFPFTVNCDCQVDYNVYLERTHGVVRFTFSDIPEYMSEIEMTMTNLGNKKAIAGAYSGQTEVTKRIPVGSFFRTENPDNTLTVVMGTFPTATDKRSAYRLRLYKNGEEDPWYNETVTDTLNVRRNQLLDISTRFKGGIPSFQVLIDTAWDGSIQGGGTDIE